MAAPKSKKSNVKKGGALTRLLLTTSIITFVLDSVPVHFSTAVLLA